MSNFRIAYGPAFAGLNARLNDRTLDRRETDQMRGVFCSQGGIQRSAGLVKVTTATAHVGYSAGFSIATSTWVKILPASGTLPELGLRWTILGAFKPTAIAGTQRVFDRLVTIGGTPYHAPSLSIGATGALTLAWVNSSGTSKNVTSTNTVSDGTVYYFIARRKDDDMDLQIATPTTSFSEWATKSGLGATDYPSDTATHGMVLGANGTNATPDTEFFEGFIDGFTVLDLALDDDELDMGYLEWPQPRMARCRMHLTLEEAAGSAFVDSGPFAYTVTHDADVTHEQTALLGSPTLVNWIGERRGSDGQQYTDFIADGNLYASRTNA